MYAAIVSVLTAGALLLSIGSPAIAHPPDSSDEIVIHMDEVGFSPSNVTITQGQKVEFENAGQKDHWPASSIHPTHQIYPEFDSGQGIPPGESWTFTFDKVGTWLMHDHLSPEFTGKVVVAKNASVTATPEAKKTDLKAQIQQLIASLRLEKDRLYFRLFPGILQQKLEKIDMHEAAQDENQLRYWIQVLGGKRVMAKLVKDSGSGSLVDCHQEAHKTGRMSYLVYGSKVFSDTTFDCHSGYYHGAMEEFLKENGTEDIANKIEKVCSDFKTSFGNFECLHGVGHGVMALVENDLPAALDICSQMNDSFTQSSCYGGSFMENVIVAESKGAGSFHQTKWVSSDPHFPCNAVDQAPDVQTQCYLMQTSRMLDINHDWNFLAAECLKAPKNMQTTCFQSLGRDASGQTLRNPQKIVDICNKVPVDYYRSCVLGSLYVIVEFWGENLTDQPQKLCETFDREKEYCYSSFGNRLPGIFTDNQKITELCNFSEKDYIAICRRSAGID